MIIKRNQELLPAPRPELLELAANEGVLLNQEEAIALNGLLLGLKPMDAREEQIRHDVMMARARGLEHADRPRVIDLALVLDLARTSIVKAQQ